MKANECSGDLPVRVGIACTTAKNSRNVLRADIVVEADLVNGIAIDHETFERCVARLVERGRKTFAIADPIILRDRAAPTHR